MSLPWFAIETPWLKIVKILNIFLFKYHNIVCEYCSCDESLMVSMKAKNNNKTNFIPVSGQQQCSSRYSLQ